jgi:hypothetical protein
LQGVQIVSSKGHDWDRQGQSAQKTRVTDCIDRRCNARPAPDAFDELCDTVHSIAVMRHDTAHAPLHVQQAAVGACE